MLPVLFEYIDFLNGNKFVWGLSMLLLNFGAKYVVGDLGKIHEAILANEITKKIIIFCLFFVATRDIITAFILSVIYVFVIDGLLHENRKFCIVPKPKQSLYEHYRSFEPWQSSG
jgi:hypothetical protein